MKCNSYGKEDEREQVLVIRTSTPIEGREGKDDDWCGVEAVPMSTSSSSAISDSVESWSLVLEVDSIVVVPHRHLYHQWYDLSREESDEQL